MFVRPAKMMYEMRNYGLFYVAGLCTLAQITTAVFIAAPANHASTAVLALLFGLFALLFIYWPMIVLYKHGGVPRTSGYLQTTNVVDRGPYTIIRHPQYLGYILINLTFMLSNPYWPGMLLGMAAIVCYYKFAQQEDRRLQASFGCAYRDYMLRVPGFNVLGGLLRLLRE